MRASRAPSQLAEGLPTLRPPPSHDWLVKKVGGNNESSIRKERGPAQAEGRRSQTCPDEENIVVSVSSCYAVHRDLGKAVPSSHL